MIQKQNSNINTPTIYKEKYLNKDDRIEYAIRLLPFILTIKALTDKEQQLLRHCFILPDNLRLTPFSLTSKRLYIKWMNISKSELSNLVKQLNDKQYLIEEDYGEKNLHPNIRRFIEGIANQKEINIVINIKEEK